MLKAFEKM